jgi:hypothetical protein
MDASLEDYKHQAKNKMKVPFWPMLSDIRNSIEFEDIQ